MIARPNQQQVEKSEPGPIPSIDDDDSDDQNPDGASVKELVVKYLASAQNGARAADIRMFAEKSLNKTLHDKTVGMTLYRLQKEGLVRRDGHVWFPAEAKAEAGDPGAGGAGAFNRAT